MNNSSILLDHLPTDWEAKKIKYVFDERKEINNPVKTDVLVSPTHDRGVILHSDKGDIGNKQKDDLTKYKIVHPGDIVVNSMNVIIGSSGLSQYFGLVSPVYYMLTKKNPVFDNRFFHYLFRSRIFQKSLVGVGNGILEHRMRVPMDKLGGHFIPLPLSFEQTLISRYLDKKTDQIDRLLEKIQKKIDLLKEQRISLINQCVTKGLPTAGRSNSNVEMKDSGVEWIGEIPKHWKLSKVKFELNIHNNIRVPLSAEERGNRQGEYPYYGSTSLIDWVDDYLFDGRYILIAEDGGNLVLRNLRLSFIVEGKFWVNNHAHILKSKSEIYDHYYCEFLEQSDFTTFITGSAQPKLTLEAIKEIPLCVPNENEISEITSELKKITDNFKKFLEVHNKKIETLKEYRQSLISSVVTGKIRVTPVEQAGRT